MRIFNILKVYLKYVIIWKSKLTARYSAFSVLSMENITTTQAIEALRAWADSQERRINKAVSPDPKRVAYVRRRIAILRWTAAALEGSK